MAMAFERKRFILLIDEIVNSYMREWNMTTTKLQNMY